MDQIREKSIFDGRIDASLKEVQDLVDFFLFENFQLPGIDFRVERVDQKQVWVIYPPKDSDSPGEKILNGFIEINLSSLSNNQPVTVHLISCRQELDLLFFQLSQKIQAKFIIRDYPPDVVTTPWKELIAQGVISPLATTMKDVLLDNNTDLKGKVPRFGRDRDLSEEEVRRIVKNCHKHKDRGGTVKTYYNTLPEGIKVKFEFETLRTWLKRFSE